MYRGTYNGQGYSPLDKINASNVKRLVPLWSYSTRSGRRPSGATDCQQRCDVYFHAAQSGVVR